MEMVSSKFCEVRKWQKNFVKQLQLWQSKNLARMKFIYKKIMKRRFCYGTLQVKKIQCSDVFYEV